MPAVSSHMACMGSGRMSSPKIRYNRLAQCVYTFRALKDTMPYINVGCKGHHVRCAYTKRVWKGSTLVIRVGIWLGCPEHDPKAGTTLQCLQGGIRRPQQASATGLPTDNKGVRDSWGRVPVNHHAPNSWESRHGRTPVTINNPMES